MLINRPIFAHFLAQNKAVCAGIGAGFRAVVRILIKSWPSDNNSHEIWGFPEKSQIPLLQFGVSDKGTYGNQTSIT